MHEPIDIYREGQLKLRASRQFPLVKGMASYILYRGGTWAHNLKFQHCSKYTKSMSRSNEQLPNVKCHGPKPLIV